MGMGDFSEGGNTGEGVWGGGGGWKSEPILINLGGREIGKEDRSAVKLNNGLGEIRPREKGQKKTQKNDNVSKK